MKDVALEAEYNSDGSLVLDEEVDKDKDKDKDYKEEEHNKVKEDIKEGGARTTEYDAEGRRYDEDGEYYEMDLDKPIIYDADGNEQDEFYDPQDPWSSRELRHIPPALLCC